MTLHEVGPLIQASLATGLLVLVLIKGGFSRTLTRWFVLFILGEMLWGLAVFGLRGSSDLEWALRWERFTPAAVSLTAISFYYFSRLMVRVSVPRWTTVLAVGHLLASLASIPSSFLVSGVVVAGYGNTAIWGDGLILWTVPVYFMMGVSVATLYRGVRWAPSYTERNRLLLLLIASSISVLGSLLDVAPVLGLDVPPATSWTNSLFFLLASVAILRYQLLDIQVTLQHRVSYLIRSTASLVLLAVGVLPFWLLNLPLWTVVLWVLALLLAAEPAWRRLDTFLRGTLEKGLRGEIETLLTLGSGQAKANNLQIADTVIRLLHRVAHPAHSALLLLEDGAARPIVSQGYAAPPEVSLLASHPLIRALESQPAPVFHDDLIVEPQFQTMTRQGLEALSALGAEIYVPLAARDSLAGILAVGPKARRGIYSWQEIEFLAALGKQSALLFESIRLSEADRVQRERMERVREIQRYMVQARDEERRSLAAEIHDDPIQMLVGSLVRLNLIRDSLVVRPEMIQQQLENVVTNITRAEKSLRRIMTGVFPSLLQDLGLKAALEALCQDLMDSEVATQEVLLNLVIRGIPSDWTPPLPVAIVIYRFIQEGLRNVLAHSGASQVWVTVDYGVEAATLEVVDNGRGVDSGRVMNRRQEGHVGLLGLEERLGAVGGNLTLDSRPEGGARLWGYFPHEAPTPDPKAEWSFEYAFTPSLLASPQGR